MASLGTLAAELKLEGAAGMMSGLRAAGGAVSSLGNVLGGLRAPVAQLDGALRAVQKTGAGTGAAVAPVQAASAALRRISGQPSRAGVARQTFGKTGAGTPGGEARQVPFVVLPRLTPARTGTVRDKMIPVNIAAGSRRQREGAAGQEPRTAAGADFARGLRGAMEQMKAGLGGSSRAAGGERRAMGSGSAGARLAAVLGQLRAAAHRGGSSSVNAGAALGAGGDRGRDGDRLAKIGGFIGGGGGPALDFHRRTAAATEKTAAGIQSLLQRLPAVEKPLTALWA